MAGEEKNRLFFSKVVEKVNQLSVSSILSKYIKIKYNRMADHDGLCPFHGDRHFGSFKISDRKGICKCFACGYYGDGIQFVKDISRNPEKPLPNKEEYKRAVLRIAVDHGICTKKQAEDYLNGKISDINIKDVSVENLKTEEKIDGVTKIASSYVRDWAYQLFLMGVSLSDEHRKYLRRRGFSDEEINEKGFFTFPQPTKEFIDSLYKRCINNNLTPNIFKRIPGFHTRKDLALDSVHPRTGEREYKYTFAKREGIGIPIKDPEGLIVGIQIRKNSVGGKQQRYTWFSSSYAAYDSNDFIFGTAAGTPTHVAYPKKNKYPGVVFITEGFFKAEQVAKTFGVACISVSGVGNYKTIPEDLRKIKNKIEHIYIAYDADVSQNIQVYHHAKNMVDLIKENLTDVNIYQTLWNEEFGKGIDDLIQAKKAHTLRKVDFDSFAKLYDELIKELESKYEKISRIPKEIVLEKYYSEVFPKVYAS